MITLCKCGWRFTHNTSEIVTCPQCKIQVQLPSPEVPIKQAMDVEALTEHWLLLHNFDLCPWDAYATSRWYVKWLDSIPCPECKAHAKELFKNGFSPAL